MWPAPILEGLSLGSWTPWYNAAAMTTHQPPRTPNFRITLFYGPELLEGRQSIQRCVFNVKKRSWKAGVQIVVELEDRQISRACASLQFEDWLARALRIVSGEDRVLYERRARELLVQSLAGLKLDIAIEMGLAQDNHQLDSHVLMPELDQRLVDCAEHIKSQIFADLDPPTPKEDAPIR